MPNIKIPTQKTLSFSSTMCVNKYVKEFSVSLSVCVLACPINHNSRTPIPICLTLEPVECLKFSRSTLIGKLSFQVKLGSQAIGYNSQLYDTIQSFGSTVSLRTDLIIPSVKKNNQKTSITNNADNNNNNNDNT